jgi:hypothetical protein
MSDNFKTLDSWDKINIVAWRKILAESVAKGDKKREDYARKMLVETLGVSEVEENNNQGSLF